MSHKLHYYNSIFFTLFHITYLHTANNELGEKQHTKIRSQTKQQVTNDIEWTCQSRLL